MEQGGDTGHAARFDLLEQLQPLAAHGRFQIGEAGVVAASLRPELTQCEVRAHLSVKLMKNLKEYEPPHRRPHLSLGETEFSFADSGRASVACN
jgi:hypothetical protein